MLIFIFGPPAVGKMTVGNELAKITGLKLFHNHMTIEPLLPLFPFGSPELQRLYTGLRLEVFKEVANSNLPGIIFTLMLDLNSQDGFDFIKETISIFESKNKPIFFVELAASQEIRLQRNRTEFRLQEKSSKRDVVSSDRHLIETDVTCRTNSENDFPFSNPFIKINNENLKPEEVAQKIAKSFNINTQ